MNVTKCIQKLLLVLLIFSSKQVCATETNKFAQLFCDRGLCAGGTEEISCLNSTIKSDTLTFLEEMGFKEGEYQSDLWEQRFRRIIANRAYERDKMKHKHLDIFSSIEMNFYLISALVILLYQLYSARKEIKQKVGKCWTFIKTMVFKPWKTSFA